MKTENIRTDKVWEFRLAITDSIELGELNKLWKNNKNKYKSKNFMLNNLISQGLELERISENNSNFYKETTALNEKLATIKSQQDVIGDWIHKGTKENFCMHNESQILLQRLYHIAIRFAQKNDIMTELYDEGIYDGMPDGFAQIQKEIKEESDEIYGK